MKIIDIKYLLKNYKSLKTVNLVGWVRSVRDSGAIAFISVNDGTDLDSVQIVIKPTAKNFSELKQIKTGAAVLINGEVVVTEGKKQDFEINANEVHHLKSSSEDYPLQKKEHSWEFLREIAHLRARSNTFNAVFRIRSELSFAIHNFYHDNGFVYVQTPILTSNDAEGAGETFDVSSGKEMFFGKKASLTVSGQLNAEAFAQAFKKVYTFGPTFRAEKSYTNRHAAEFWMIEPEVAFADLEQNMALIEAFVKYLSEYILNNCLKELKFLETNKIGLIENIKNILEKPFKKMKYQEAISILQNAIASGHKFENNNVEFGTDLNSEHERFICEKIVNGPVFLTHFPKEIKAFYMKVSSDNKTVQACDLLVPHIGEIVGGSQREDDYDSLKKRCEELKIDTKDLQWYLDLRKYGYYKSAGFGLGFERLLMYFTGQDNIRDVIPFARTAGSIKF